MENEVEVKECFDFLYLNQRHLTASQATFVKGLKTYYTRNKTLSERQTKALFEIRKYLQVPETVRYSNKQ